jgi:hypothetical protein
VAELFSTFYGGNAAIIATDSFTSGERFANLGGGGLIREEMTAFDEILVVGTSLSPAVVVSGKGFPSLPVYHPYGV